MPSQPDVRALRIHGRDDLRLDRDPAPVAAPDEVLVDVGFGGVCGSDLHYWRDGAVGDSVLRAPMILGHEVVGRVAVPAADGSGPPARQAVAVHPARSCGHCPWCTEGRSNLCPGTRYLGSAAHVPHTDGGFADRIAVPASRLIPLPDTLDLRRASLAEPAGIAWHALDRAEAVGAPIGGADVLVIGGGPIGLLVAAVARYRDAASVTVADVQDHPLAVAAALGVHAVHARHLADGADPSGTGPSGTGPSGRDNSKRLGRADAPRDNSKKRGAPGIVVESSGTVPGLASAIRSARPGGTVVAVGQVPAGDIAVPASLCVARELTLTGSLRLIEIERSVAFLADPRAVVDPIVTDVFPASQAAGAFAVAADPARSSKVLLDFSR
ncbi:MAG TPA: alcohol dehydrogenase catalytic domain-containing protein [Streptosporangiaceae bacterium]|nr:alcohol dehydrogenase catalytic domain-containing protein [Streptosporangiaceae bacterium]